MMVCSYCKDCEQSRYQINGYFCMFLNCYIEYFKLPKCGIMNGKEFFLEVAKMRQLQKKYYSTRDKVVLNKSIEQEKLIDAEIERVNKILNK